MRTTSHEKARPRGALFFAAVAVAGLLLQGSVGRAGAEGIAERLRERFFLAGGPETTDIRTVVPFRRLLVDGPGRIIIDPDGGSVVQVRAAAAAIPTIVTTSRTPPDGEPTLEIGLASERESSRVPLFEARVGVDEIDTICVRGSAAVQFAGALSCDALEIEVSGGGSVVGRVEAGRLVVVLASDGTARVSGSAQSALVVINGNGTVDLRGLETGDLEYRRNGAGRLVR